MNGKPRVTATFLQPDAFNDFSNEQWDIHMANLREAGIDTIIIQWIAESPYAEVKRIYYPSDSVSGVKTDFLPVLLDAAVRNGMKLWIGLNISDEWWEFACSKDDWNRAQTELGLRIAREIYEKYGTTYREQLAGWYFAWEMFNGMYGGETLAADFLNMYLDGLTALSPELPVMLSPFVRSVGGDAATAEREWKKVFSLTRFRKGDIFCCQDAVGAEHITIDELDGYFAALRRAVDTVPGIRFWANSECFRRVSPSVFTTALVDRWIRQMRIASPYVDGYVTFAYSHYFSPDIIGRRDEHEAYLRYLSD